MPKRTRIAPKGTHFGFKRSTRKSVWGGLDKRKGLTNGKFLGSPTGRARKR